MFDMLSVAMMGVTLALIVLYDWVAKKHNRRNLRFTRKIPLNKLFAYDFTYNCQKTRLYLYRKRGNFWSPRAARQNWWQEVKQVRPGYFKPVGRKFKDNVGYVEIEGFDWCHPYRKATLEDLQPSAR